MIHSTKVTDRNGGQITNKVLKESFKEAIGIHRKLLLKQKKIAYFFIDPLLNSFEAANQFYFNIFDCTSISKLNTYKSGASPIQALADANELIKTDLYDAVFIFGFEPLLTNKQVYGKEEVTKAMRIFDSHSIIECYNEIAVELCCEINITESEFVEVCDLLFANYCKTYGQYSGFPQTRGKFLNDHGANLFKLTDCANPNIDFAGGIILTNKETADLLQVPEVEKVKVAGVSYSMIEGAPEKISQIVGKNGNVFSHLRQAVIKAQNDANINLSLEFKTRNLLIEVYTCYPPIPIAFLLASDIIENIHQLRQLLDEYEITITGGMNLARAPWNNPALNGMIEMYQKLKFSHATYGVVHGNGGIGETQGVAVFERSGQADHH